MRSGEGFQTMEQVARLYDLDVMALVSYDQVAHTAERSSSFLYWTIVGAYVIEGNKNDVNTFVDTAVFDVPTRKLLFRAPGVSEIKSTSTLVGVESDMRAGQQKGFDEAMADMTVNLDKELDAFKDRIRRDQSVRVTHSSGYSGGGGGAGGPASLAALLVCSWECDAECPETAVERRPPPFRASYAPPDGLPMNQPRSLSAATLGALGVVYGDIGTSPLYALREATAVAGGATDATAMLGVLSLIFWSMLIIITLKYIVVILRMDNDGEGGVLSLVALVEDKLPGNGKAAKRLVAARGARHGLLLLRRAHHARDLGDGRGRRPRDHRPADAAIRRAGDARDPRRRCLPCSAAARSASAGCSARSW